VYFSDDYLDLTFPHLHWPSLPKIKGCALHWHAAKDEKLRVAMVSPSSLLPGFNISAFALAAAAKDKKMCVALARSQRLKVARGNGLAQFLITWI